MIRQTGGFAVGTISTKSSSAAAALLKASCKLTTPICSPSWPIKRTSLTEICSFRRLCFLSIKRFLHSKFNTMPGPSTAAARDLFEQLGRKLLQRHAAQILAFACSYGYGTRLEFAVP